jgi:hypothetical protein
MHPGSGNLSHNHQRRSHKAMSYHERDCRFLFLRKRQEPRRKLFGAITVKRYEARGPMAVKNREQQQRIFGRLSERICLLDQ